jgi:hypothetical protein
VSGATTATTTTSSAGGNRQQINHTAFNYFSSLPPNEANTYYGKLPNSLKFNIDNAWNPVDSYIYGPTSKTIFNQNEVADPIQTPQQKFTKFDSGHHLKEAMNQKGQNKFGGSANNQFMGSGKGSGGTHAGGYINNIMSGSSIGSGHNFKDILAPNTVGYMSSGGLVSGLSGTHREKERFSKQSHNRKLVGEFYDNETPKLCDHTAIEKTDSKMRPCTPMESYVSTGNNMVSVR